MRLKHDGFIAHCRGDAEQVFMFIIGEWQRFMAFYIKFWYYDGLW